MNTKIRVDPKTFKIINQGKNEESLSSGSETTTSVVSESSSGSDSESIRVIKLHGGNDQLQPSQKNTPLQNSYLQSKPPQQQSSKQQPPQQQPHQQQPSLQSKPPQPISNSKTNIESYLSENNNEDLSIQNFGEESTEQSFEDSVEKSSEESIVEPKIEAVAEPDVIDLSQSKLFDILHSIFTDSNGISVSENIEKMSKLFDKHNQIMEKILNQLIIMNSNHKQIRIPDAVQTNTKIANNDDFRNTKN